MKRINENRKITLTLGQLRRLVKESLDDARLEAIRSEMWARKRWQAEMVMSDVNDKGSDLIGEIGEWAIVTKNEDGMVHLDYTCNASDEMYVIEQYDILGWWIDANDLNNKNFWDVWSEWNGYMIGGIDETDYEYDDDADTGTPEWDEMVSKHKTLSISKLATAPAGTYAIKV